MTIRRRITVATTVAVAISIVVVAVGAYVAARRQVLGPIDDSLQRRAVALSRLTESELPRRGQAPPVRGTITVPARPGDFDAVYYQVALADGSVLDIGEDDEVTLPVPGERARRSEEPTLRSVWVDDVHLRVATVGGGASGAYVQIARPLTEADETLRRFAGMLTIGGLVGVALAIGFGTVVSASAVRPIDDLQAAITDIATSGRIDTRLEADGDDEVAELAHAFDDLLARLEQAKAQQIRLVRDAGHELRTPLTALRMNLEMLTRHRVPEEDRAAMIEAAYAEVEELSALVTEIVDLATERYEEEPVGDVDLDEVVEGVVERARRRSDRRIEFDGDGSTVRGRREALDRAVSNIVANAETWSPDGGVISVEVRGGSVTVSDEGPGFAPEDLPHVFERFYRSDQARTRPGSGLGLSIVDQIVTDHGGEVFARNRPDPPGAEVGFRLPTP